MEQGKCKSDFHQREEWFLKQRTSVYMSALRKILEEVASDSLDKYVVDLGATEDHPRSQARQFVSFADKSV